MKNLEEMKRVTSLTCKIEEEKENFEFCFWENHQNLYSMTHIDELASHCQKWDGISLCSQIVCLIDVSSKKAIDGNTIVVKLDGAPIITNKTTSELIKEYDKGRAFPYEALRLAINDVLKETIKKFPHISGKSLFIPVDGVIKKNTSWYNLLLVEDIMTYQSKEYEGEESKISFVNHLELVVPTASKTTEKRAKTSLMLYFTYLDFITSLFLAEGAEMFSSKPWLGGYAKKIVKQYGREKFSISHLELHNQLIQVRNRLLLEQKYQISAKEILELENIWMSKEK